MRAMILKVYKSIEMWTVGRAFKVYFYFENVMNLGSDASRYTLVNLQILSKDGRKVLLTVTIYHGKMDKKEGCAVHMTGSVTFAALSVVQTA